MDRFTDSTGHTPHTTTSSSRRSGGGSSSSSSAAAVAASSKRRKLPSPHEVWTGSPPPRLGDGMGGMDAARAYAPVAGLGWPQEQGRLGAGQGDVRVRQGSYSIATFNVLAPCYKRMRNGGREADFPERMQQRALETAEFIRCVLPLLCMCMCVCGRGRC
jgi:hypothetical protein